MSCVLLQVFSDQLLLQDVLARSDRAMAVVKDLFGDAPRRQTGNKIFVLLLFAVDRFLFVDCYL